MTLILAMLLASQPPPAPVDPAPIVVTGRLPDYRAALAACLARNCPVNEDADASLALAEALVVSGDYQDAHGVIRGSLRRNGRHAARFPEPVSDLHRANGRVTRHLGIDQEAQRSAHEVLSALQAGIPREDHRHFTARLELASSLIAFGRYREARAELGRLMEVARAAGRGDVAQLAELRTMWIGYLENPGGPTRRRLETLSRSADPQQSVLAAGARRMLAQIHRERGDEAAAARVLPAGAPSARRNLLFSPPYELAQQERSALEQGFGAGSLSSGKVINRSSDNFDDAWIDVSFRILPDGMVADVVVARQGSDPDWAEPLLGSIRGRRYSPGGETERLERYTYIAPLEARTGSHIQQRSPRARVEYLDLTPPEGSAAAGPPDATGPGGG